MRIAEAATAVFDAAKALEPPHAAPNEWMGRELPKLRLRLQRRRL
ncbi:MAG TPA: hypothetical protein VFW75_15465 [Acetobacteraceae bacterium]|nr:hypothetical protein [Acetobacteraceae bacterium]